MDKNSITAYHEIGGVIPAMQRRVLARIEQSPGHTSREIEAWWVPDAHKRMSELLSLGLIVRGPRRKCMITGCTAHTYNPTGQQIFSRPMKQKKPTRAQLEARIAELEAEIVRLKVER